MSNPRANQRIEVGSRILAGLLANPSVIAPNSTNGWELVNCNANDIVAFADHLAAILIDLREPKP